MASTDEMTSKTFSLQDMQEEAIRRYDAEGIDIRKARQYRSFLDAKETIAYISLGCPPEIANRYSAFMLVPEAVVALHSCGIGPNEIRKICNNKEYFVETRFSDSGSRLLGGVTVVYQHNKNISLLEIGGFSIIVSDGIQMWKVCYSNEQEKVYLKMIKEYHCSLQKNLPHLISFVEEEFVGELTKEIFKYTPAVEIKYIPGRSLQQILFEETKFPREKTIKYISDIFNGLLELRQAGIWHHRDIRPANIMIDEEKDRAVIIDLGIATTDKDALAEDNRRFGSPSSRRANDLTSLGQVVYKMATGEHIFAESKSMERTTYADKLRDQRDWIYEDPKERLKPHLHTVSKRIESVTIRNIINFCLTAQGTDEEYQQLEQMFGEYVT